MEIAQNIDLKPYNTFGFSYEAKSAYFFQSIEDLEKLHQTHEWFRASNFLILGGGSNILLTQNIEQPVLINEINDSISIIEESEDHITLEVGAGKNWHDFVIWTIDNGYGGLENLSLIPGKVGAAPMQNIGAYGVEIKDSLHSLRAFDIQKGEMTTFTNAACQLGYRESIFKRERKGQFIIAYVRFTLTKRNHKLNTAYGAITSELEANGITTPTIKDISNAVIAIRQSKLPDPKKLGNSGSFFKNPVVPLDIFETLQKDYSNIVGFPVYNGVKLAAGWLIEQTGWKGKQIGNVGVHKKQALVLVHYGGGKGEDLLALSKAVQDAVLKKFGVTLEPEVNIL
ncbi:MAG: UDP-N-acetylmuramate dehydrogenase [Schleiferiaceae bacterium]|nr:UDP-N-acetylmuramate dehydrogenase [Schleiferiaceae bacterium]